MPPIPIHKNDPINPHKGTTPTTSTPTAANASGASPQTANPPPTRTTPYSIPATTTSSSSDPPAPQPGARPTPTASAQNTAGSGGGPPSPQPGYTATHTTTESRLGGPPPQFNVPPPSGGALPGRSTAPVTGASNQGPGPTMLNFGAAAPAPSPFQAAHTGGAVPGEGEGRRSLEHPPGYQQAPDNSAYLPGPAGGQQSGGAGASDGSVGDAAWNMLSKAGEALKKGEEAVWRNVRSKG